MRKTMTAIALTSALATSMAATPAASWKAFNDFFDPGSRIWKNKWNNSQAKKDLQGMGKGACWTEALKVGFTAGIHKPDSEKCP